LARYRDWLGVAFPPGFQIRIRIYGDKATYNQTIERIDEPWLRHAAGHYDSGRKEVITWQQQETLLLLKVVFHEISHAMVDAQVPGLPSWLDEGLANYIALVSLGQVPFAWELQRKYLRDCREAITTGVIRPLEELLSLRYKEFHSWDQRYLYSASWSLVWFLDRNERTNRSLLRTIVLNFKSPESARKELIPLINAAYSGGLKKLDAEWRSWLLQHQP
jgi:hypothetical protein